MDDKQKAENYRRGLEKHSLQGVQFNKRIRELEAALSMCHHYAYDDSHGLDDDDALDRIRAIAYKALEQAR